MKDVDFGFAVPIIPPSASSPTTPNDNQLATSTSQPAPADEPSSSPSLSRPGRARLSISSTPNDANTSAKRRKLDHDPPVPPSSGRSTRSSQPRPDIYTITDDTPTEPPELTREDAIVIPLPASAQTDRIPETQDSVEASITEPHPTPSVHFADESISILADGTRLVESMHKDTTDDTTSRLVAVGSGDEAELTEIETPIPSRKRNRKAVVVRKTVRKSQSPIEDDLDELSPLQPANVTQLTKSVRKAKRIEDDRDPLSDPVEPDDAEEVDDVEAARVLSRTRSKRKSIDPAPTSLQEEDIEDVVMPRLKRRRKEREERDRVKRRQPKKSDSQRVRSSTKRSSEKPRLRAGSPIPVVIHRLTEGLMYEGDDPDIDILNAEIPNAKRPGVNAIDTLRQVCEESFGIAQETLQEGRNNAGDNATRREYMTKYRAVSSFAEEVYARLVEHVRLFLHSFASDHH